jgi:hypothetical protein
LSGTGSSPDPKGTKLGYLILDDGEASRGKLKEVVREAVGLACTQAGLAKAAIDPIVVNESAKLADASKFVTEADRLPYWLLVDSALEGESGEELLQVVKRLGYPADVVYYSRAEGKLTLKGVGPLRYCKVSLARWDDLPAKVEQMAREFLLKWTDPDYVRGLVLSRAVDVEVAMDSCILAYFGIDKTQEPTFRKELLGKNGAQLGPRLTVLEKAVRQVGSNAKGPSEFGKMSTGSLKKLLEGTRNIFAHNIVVPDPKEPFIVKLRHKAGGAAEYSYEREGLQEYFLDCSRALMALEKLGDKLEAVSKVEVANSHQPEPAKRSRPSQA